MRDESVRTRPALPPSPGVAKVVRTKRERRGAPAAASRFEMRLSASQLAGWRTFADSERVSLADLVRVAVEHVMTSQPLGWARAELRRGLDAEIECMRALMRGDPCTDTEPRCENHETFGDQEPSL